VFVVDDGRFAVCAIVLLRVFRDLIVGFVDVVRKELVLIMMGKMFDQMGYLKDLRDENIEEGNECIENLMELVLAAREYEMCELEVLFGGFVDRLLFLSEVVWYEFQGVGVIELFQDGIG